MYVLLVLNLFACFIVNGTLSVIQMYLNTEFLFLSVQYVSMYKFVLFLDLIRVSLLDFCIAIMMYFQWFCVFIARGLNALFHFLLGFYEFLWNWLRYVEVDKLMFYVFLDLKALLSFQPNYERLIAGLILILHSLIIQSES